MHFKFMFKNLYLENEQIIFKTLFKKRIINHNNIVIMYLKNPKNKFISGSYYDYRTYFYIILNNDVPVKFNTVLLDEENEYLLNYLKRNNIIVNLTYHDIKIDFGCGD